MTLSNPVAVLFYIFFQVKTKPKIYLFRKQPLAVKYIDELD